MSSISVVGLVIVFGVIFDPNDAHVEDSFPIESISSDLGELDLRRTNDIDLSDGIPIDENDLKRHLAEKQQSIRDETKDITEWPTLSTSYQHFKKNEWPDEKKRQRNSSNTLVQGGTRTVAPRSVDSSQTSQQPPTTLCSTSTTPMPPSTTPFDRRNRRIFNPDESASIEDYPFMAALLVNKELWCGAVILGRRTLLTAAHCLQLQYNNRFFREYVKMLEVRVGSANVSHGGSVYQVTEIFFHPNYKPQTLEFNFAVLKLEKNLTFMKDDEMVDSIKVSKDKLLPVDKTISFLGWGSVVDAGGAGGRVVLQKVDLPIYDLADCQAVYGRNLVTRNNFCAGYITVAKNVCNHDAGGPALLDGLLVGILSFSNKRCDELDKPAVFSNVGKASEWLENIGAVKNPGIKFLR